MCIQYTDLYCRIQSIDTDVYEAADLDGATGFKRFSKITFPLLAPSFTINMVLSAKGYLMVYDQIMAMTDGGPGTATTSIAVLIYKKDLAEDSSPTSQPMQLCFSS